MFNNLGWGELMMLGLLGLLVFGPDQLPKVAADLGRMIRTLRKFAKDTSNDLRNELGETFDDVDLASLNPRKFIEKHVIGDGDDDDIEPAPKPRTSRMQQEVASSGAPAAAAVEPAVPAPYDADAT